MSAKDLKLRTPLPGKAFDAENDGLNALMLRLAVVAATMAAFRLG
jgi:hypothetical protein